MFTGFNDIYLFYFSWGHLENCFFWSAMFLMEKIEWKNIACDLLRYLSVCIYPSEKKIQKKNKKRYSFAKLTKITFYANYKNYNKVKHLSLIL